MATGRWAEFMYFRYRPVSPLTASGLGASGVTITQRYADSGLPKASALVHAAVMDDLAPYEKPVSEFLQPRHWPAWLGLGILRAASHLSYGETVRYGRALGMGMLAMVPIRARVAAINIGLCFPELTPAERAAIVREHYAQVGIATLELGLNWYRVGADYNVPYRFSGLEHVEAARRSGRGVLLVGGHFAHIETTAKIVIANVPMMSAVYRPPNQPLLAREMHLRRNIAVDPIPMGDVKRLIRNLRAGHAIFFYPDQGRKIKESALIPFFGEPAITNTATARIARMGNAALLPLQSRRLPGAQGVEVRILPEMPLRETDTAEDVAHAINQRIEADVRAEPAQYFWLHKRFKNRGPEFPDVYARK